MLILRTADEHFANLPDFPYAPRYCELPDQDGGVLRVAWVENGPAEADPVQHFLQEDAGEGLAEAIVRFLAR